MTRREKNSVTIPISSLIDVVFLLIVFFIVTAKLESEIVDDQVKLADSYHVKPTTPTNAFTINVRRGEDVSSTIYTVDGMPMTLEQIVLRAQRAKRQIGDSMEIVLRADSDLEYGKIDTLTRRLSNVGLYRIQHTAVSHAE